MCYAVLARATGACSVFLCVCAAAAGVCYLESRQDMRFHAFSLLVCLLLRVRCPYSGEAVRVQLTFLGLMVV